MQLATRQICGFCSVEQNLSKSGICVACEHDMTGTRGSAYWEGGEGCRDPSKMAHNESRKTKGQAKTASQKANRVGAAGKERRETAANTGATK